MSVKASVNRYPIDSLLVLDGPANAPVTKTSSTGTTNSIALDVLNSYWASGDVAEPYDFAVVLEVTAVSGTTPTFAFTVQVAPDSGAFASPVTVAESVAPSAAGRYVVTVPRDDIITALAGASVGSLRGYLTLGGTSPSISYTAYVAPLVGL